MTADDVFENGKRYEVWIRYTRKPGYKFDKTTVYTINGSKILGNVGASGNGSYYIRSSPSYYTTYPGTVMTSASVTMPVPVVGGKPYRTVTSGDPDKYDAYIDNNFIGWRKGSSWDDSVTMRYNEVFEAGKPYIALIECAPKDGYAFDENKTVCTINGKPATLLRSIGNAYGKAVFYVSFTPTAAHVHTPSTAWKTDAAYHWHTCSGCSELLNKAAHSYGAWKVTKAATSTATGSRERTCSVCGYKQTEAIPMLSHTHSYTGTWKYDTVNHWQLCSCGEKGNTSAHSYGAWKVTKAATSTATGSRERVCSVCGYKQTEAIPMLSHTHNYTGAWKSDATNHWQLCSCGEKGNTSAHTYGAWKVTKAATATAEGSRERVCAICGYKQTEVITMLSHTHNFTSAWKSDATGHWQICISCAEKGSISPHTYGEWRIKKSPSATSEGSREHVCAVCGYKETEVIPTLSHIHAYGTEWKNDDSQHWHECDCGEKSDTIAHTYGDWTVIKAATTTDEGLKNRICSVCGYEEYKVIPVSGSVTPETDTTEPDMTEPGGTVTAAPDTSTPIETEIEKDEGTFPWWIIVVAVVAIAGVAAVIVIVKKKK